MAEQPRDDEQSRSPATGAGVARWSAALGRWWSVLRGQPASAGWLPPGRRLYAIGDIHGFSNLLAQLTRTIETDLAQNPPAIAEAVLLGDYIDRGPDSSGVLARLAAADLPLPFTPLRGNHEDLMLRALADPDNMGHWCQSGGIETMASYGIVAAKTGRKSLAKARLALIERLPAAHRAFLESTVLSTTAGGYFLAHAGAKPGVPLERQAAEDLMWIRDEFHRSHYDFGKVVVHGHTPHPQPENEPRRINVDTGAFKWGVLTCVVLEGPERRFLSTRA